MNYYKEIKNLIEEKEVNDKVRYLESNKETIKTYYEIGRLLIKAQGGEEKAKYGDGLIKKWSEKLTKEYGNGYSEKNLKRMRKFYIYFKNEKVMFTGDFLFYRSIGRTDLDTGSDIDMIKSLEKISKYPDDIVIYPGHGPKSTLGREKNNFKYYY